MSSARDARLPLEIGKSSEFSRSSNPIRKNALYEFGNFRIDEANQQLIHKQHIVTIQPKTFDTLLALVKLSLGRGKDGLITKDELMREVWQDASVEEGNLPDAISNLRAALGDDPQKPTYIATAHKKGYRFLVDVTLLERETGEPEQSQQIKQYEAKISDLIASADLAKQDAEQQKILWADESAKRKEYERKLDELTSASASATRELERQKMARTKIKRWAFLGAACAALTSVAAFVSGRALSSRISQSSSAWLSLPLPDIKEPGSFSISRDGSQIVFSAISGQGRRSLYVRSMTGDSPLRIEGTEGGVQPFWSPDGRQIGFFADDKLKTIDRGGGIPKVLWRASRPGGGTWNSQNLILFAPQISAEIFKVDLSSENQRPQALTKLQNHEAGHLWPSFLPDNQHFLFTVRTIGNAKPRSVYVGSVRSAEVKSIIEGADSNAVYVPVNDKVGHLLFMQGDNLIAQPFRTDTLQAFGSQTRVVSKVGYLETLSRGEFSASYNGDIVFGPSPKHIAHLMWYSRSGTPLGEVGGIGYLLQHSISPDGQEVAMDRLNVSLGTYDIWILNLLSGREKKITSDRFDDYSAFWSPDGSRLIYSCYASTSASTTNYANLCERSADGSGAEHVLHPAFETQIPTDWSRDGKFVAFYIRDSTANKSDPQRAIRLLELNGKVTAPFPSCDCDEWQATFSPHVNWIAYTSDASGRNEVYVRPFPFRNGATIPISREGGSLPHWSRDGRELFYVSADQHLMATSFDEKTHVVGPPAPLFQASFERPGTVVYSYAISSDSNRFLVRSTISEESKSPVTVLLNWFTQLQTTALK